MSASIKANTSEVFKRILQYIGLDDFTIQLNDCINDNTYYLTFNKKVDYYDVSHAKNPEQLAKILDYIVERVEKSPAVTNAKAELTDKLKDLEEKHKLLSDLYLETKKYQDYYDLTVKMEQAKN